MDHKKHCEDMGMEPLIEFKGSVRSFDCYSYDLFTSNVYDIYDRYSDPQKGRIVSCTHAGSVSISVFDKEIEEYEIICMNSIETTGCEDSDGGKDFFTKGTTSNETDSQTDICKDSDTLYEYYCYMKRVSRNSKYCTEGCEDGKCNPEKTSDCVDSDGFDYFTQGNVVDSGEVYTDECVNSTQLREYVCTSKNVMNAITTHCFKGCSDGRCLIEQSS